MSLLSSGPALAADGFYFADSAAVSVADDVAQWAPPADHTLPQTVDDEKKYVRQLFDAFKSLDTANEQPSSHARKRFADGFYQDWMVEARAWEIVGIAKRIHTEGFKSRIYDSNILKAISKTKDWTFAKRIDTLCDVLKVSKSVACSLMKDERTMTAIGAPNKLLASLNSNHQTNASRNRWVKEGRAQDKGIKRQRTGDDEDRAEHDPDEALAAMPWNPNTDALVLDATTTVDGTASFDTTIALPPSESA